MENIISPVNRDLIKSELTQENFIRETNFENNEIYIFKADECPNTMKEIGRLREIAYRHSGGGSGKAMDIDDFDTGQTPYYQMIVWNPKEEEIIGGYRYIKMKDAPKDENGNYKLATTNMFHLGETFINEYMPYAIELGKSFVQPSFQPSVDNKKGMFSLDNLWDGLGALIVDNPEIEYFYGRVTLYLTFDKLARDYLLYFLYTYFGDKENLVYPYKPEKIKSSKAKIEKIFKGDNFKEDFAQLNQAVRERGENIPPLIKAYMSLSPGMKIFGIAHNYTFGDNVEGIAILVNINEIYPSKKRRHVETYIKQKR